MTATSHTDRFRHEALLYASDAEFLSATVPFIRDGVRAGEPVLVVESLKKIDQLRAALAGDARHVLFADMATVGANPARIIPAWQEFVDRNRGARRLRGIGEPISSSRTADELVECQRHEALLNDAFARGRPWWLMCPYDVSQLPLDVIDEARRSHEFIESRAGKVTSTEFSSTVARTPVNAGLSEPSTIVRTYPFDRDSLTKFRHWLVTALDRSALSDADARQLVIAANEVATNSLVHGGGNGVARLWFEPNRVVCEFRDAGTIDEPLVDRRRPGLELSASRGLWLANQLCDLVQVRSGVNGTVVRLHKVLPQTVELNN